MHLMQDASLSSHNILMLRMLHHMLQQHGRRPHHISHLQHRTLTLRMSQHQGSRMLLPKLHDGLHREALMHMTSTLPQQHLAACHSIDI